LDHHVRGCGVLALDREAVYIEELQTGCDVVKWIWRVANLIAECKSPYGASFVWLHELHHCMACVEEKKGSEFLVSSNAVLKAVPDFTMCPYSLVVSTRIRIFSA
jgi:hypothetical protein